MHEPLKPSVVIFVADVAGMTAFYAELASLDTVHADRDHAVLDMPGLQLVIHAMRGAQRENHSAPVPLREDATVKLCLPVDSIGAARDRAAKLGGAIKAAKYEWEARGFRACDGNDPEGNVIQVRETAA